MIEDHSNLWLALGLLLFLGCEAKTPLDSQGGSEGGNSGSGGRGGGGAVEEHQDSPGPFFHHAERGNLQFPWVEQGRGLRAQGGFPGRIESGPDAKRL